MRFKQELTVDDLREAYRLHDSTSKWKLARPFIGLALIGFAITWLFIDHLDNAMYIYFGVGVYFLVSNRMYRALLVRKAVSDRALIMPTEVEFDGAGMLGLASERGRTQMKLETLRGYAEGRRYVLLYVSRMLFYIFKRETVEEAGGVDALVAMFRSAGLRDMG